ncbi:hypothetical protein BaRGS_00028233, partial [Batillaria attramentaria]
HQRPVASSCFAAIFLLVPGCWGQGRLQMPLGRSSIWRAGVDTPQNFDDHMLECGGLWYKMKRGNMCGMCGDPVDKPRQNEAGGKYDTGMMAASFRPGERAQLKVLMMSNHGGFMEFKMCPSKPATQECFDRNPIQMADGSGSRWYLPKAAQGVMTINVIIPSMTCQNCVMQWTYTGSTEWGMDAQGNECEGCGPQYELRNCADVAIMPGGQAQIDPAIRKYNDAENGGRNPMGTYYFDPWAEAPQGGNDMDRQQSGSPFVQDPWANPSPPRRPMGNNQVDPWTNPPQVRSPFERDPWNQVRTTPAPWGRPNQPDPWTNPPPNRSPFGPRRPMRGNNQPDPWTNPPMRGNNPMDPWPRVTPAPRMGGNNRMDPWPRATPAPRMMGNNQRDPWPGTPRATPAPRMMGNNQRDPWTNPPRATPAPRMMGNNRRDPWQGTPRQTPAPRMRRNNQMDPWPNNQRMTGNNQRMTGNNQMDPWPNTQRMPGNNRRMTGNNRRMTGNNQRMTGNNQMDPWPNTQRGNQQQRMTDNNQPDPWTNPPQMNRDPWTNPPRQNSPRQMTMTNNNRPDPWVNSGSPMTPQRSPPANRMNDPWMNSPQGNSGSPFSPPAGGQGNDPWGQNVPGDSVIYNVEVGNQPVMLQPSMTCVAVGEKAGEEGMDQWSALFLLGEGMDQWCTDNCNLNYCPQLHCSC